MCVLFFFAPQHLQKRPCAPCNAFVGAGFYPARGRGRAPPLRTARYTSVGADDPVAVPKISTLPYGGRWKF